MGRVWIRPQEPGLAHVVFESRGPQQQVSRAKLSQGWRANTHRALGHPAGVRVLLQLLPYWELKQPPSAGVWWTCVYALGWGFMVAWVG